MKFTCRRYPNALIHPHGVRFHNGEAEVADSKVIAAFKKLDHLGIEASEEPEPRPKPKSKREE